MAIINIDFERTEYKLSIGGKEYAVAQRTGELEKKLREHDKNIGTMTEFESNYELISLLLGKTAAKELFPRGEKENLDRLAKIAFYAVKYFNAAKDAMDKEQLREKTKELEQITKPLADTVRLIDDEHINK